ncbi:MAG: hypothetical protein OXR73_08005, partial [Myxococcales bacterium]|nr:hypothetical protein [Myxococcales bacterium]
MSCIPKPYLLLLAFASGGCALLGYEPEEPKDAATEAPAPNEQHDGSVAGRPVDAAMPCPGCATDGGQAGCGDGRRTGAQGDGDCGVPNCEPCDATTPCVADAGCPSVGCRDAGACCNARDGNCDGRDDDCDGTIDEDFTGSSTTCGVGACVGNTGTLTCVAGATVDSCDALAGAAADDASCNGDDDDCDGATDEDFTSSPTTCGVGACDGNTGTLTCVAGATVDSCDALAGAVAYDASCNGDDDDCDGAIDEDFTSSPTTCGVGACDGNTGTLTCVAGATVDSCDALAGAAADDASCDGSDNDCDGTTDEDFTTSATTCGVGACDGSTGTVTCQLGVSVDTCDPLAGSTPEGPEGDVTCSNGVDEDCDRLVDDEDPNCWSPSGWLYRKQIRLFASEVSADLADFPV